MRFSRALLRGVSSLVLLAPPSVACAEALFHSCKSGAPFPAEKAILSNATDEIIENGVRLRSDMTVLTPLVFGSAEVSSPQLQIAQVTTTGPDIFGRNHDEAAKPSF